MNHPYKKYETTELWHIISEAIGELVANQNIEEMTSREYIVGYLSTERIVIKKFSMTALVILLGKIQGVF